MVDRPRQNWPIACLINSHHPTRVNFQRAREKSGDGEAPFLSQRLRTVRTQAKSQDIEKKSSFSYQEYNYLH